MILQSTSWNCYPTAVSIATDIPVEKLIELIGHDGSKIVDPSKDDPGKRAAFNQSEMSLALLKLGWALIPLKASFAYPDDSFSATYPDIEDLLDSLSEQFDYLILIVQQPSGGHHAVVYSSDINSMYDPKVGKWYACEERPIVSIEVLVEISKS